MAFLNLNLLLAGLACIAVPILIHFLMRRRRKVVRWGAMRFLLEAYRQQRRRMRLEQWLLLAARCLLVALIALALGRPVTDEAKASGSRGPTTLYILIDNSLASQAVANGPQALDRHKEAAARLIRDLDAARGDRVAIVTLGAPADGLVLPPSADLASAEAALALVAPTESAADLHAAVALVSADADAVEPERLSDAVWVAVLSEFREGSLDLDRPLPPALPAVRARAAGPALVWASRPAPPPITNITVLDAEPLTPVLFRAPGEAGPPASVPVRVTLRRDGASVGTAGSTRVHVAIGRPGRESASSSVLASWTPGQARAAVTVQAALPARSGPADPAGDSGLVVHAFADDPSLVGDNHLFRRAVVREQVRVGVVASASGRDEGVREMGPAGWVRLALEPTDAGPWAGQDADAQVATRPIDPAALNAAELAGLDALVVASPELVDAAGWTALRARVDAGVPLIVFPAPGASQAWTGLFLDRMALDWTIAPESRVFDPPVALALAPQTDGSLLERLAPELPDLIAPVRVIRALDMGPAPRLQSPILAGELPLIAASAPGSGDAPAGPALVVLIATPLDLAWTDLPAKPLVVPLLHELVRQAVGRSASGASASAGVASLPALGLGISASTLRALDGPAARAGAQAPRLAVQPGGVVPLPRAGVYQASDAAGSTLGLVTVDADARAGLVGPVDERAVASHLGTLAADPAAPGAAPVRWLDEEPRSSAAGPSAGAEDRGLGAGRDDADRWGLWLLAAALALAAAEMLMARFFSHASRVAAPAAPATIGAAPGAAA